MSVFTFCGGWRHLGSCVGDVIKETGYQGILENFVIKLNRSASDKNQDEFGNVCIFSKPRKSKNDDGQFISYVISIKIHLNGYCLGASFPLV